MEGDALRVFRRRDEEYLNCALCERARRSVRYLIASDHAAICDECVESARVSMLQQESLFIPRCPAKAQDFLEDLTSRVVGHREALQAVAALMWLQRRRAEEANPRTDVPHLLVVGSSGSAKTTLAQALAASIELPAVHGSAAALLSGNGGGENSLKQLWRRSAYRLELARRGVLILEDLHLLAGDDSRKAAAGGHGLAESQLTQILDGQEFYFGALADGVERTVFSSNRVWVVGLASVDDFYIPAAATDEQLRDILIAHGYSSILLSRFSKIIHLQRRTAAELRDILLLDDGPLMRIRETFLALGAVLTVSDTALDLLAQHAAASADGAWGLERALSSFMTRCISQDAVSGTILLDAAAMTQVLHGQ